MNTGIFGEGFPYSNFHDLNMDWLIKIAKDFLDQYSHIQDIISNGITELNSTTQEGIDSLTNKYNDLNDLLDSWYETHSEDIANALADAILDFQTEARRIVDTVVSDIPADYSDLSTLVTTLKEIAISDEQRFTNANNNIFNYQAVDKGYVLTNAGVVSEVATGYTSFPIPVEPSTQYHKRYVFSSANVADVCFYTSNMTYISSSTNGNGTFTTPSNCAYIKACGYITNLAGDVIEKGNSYTQHHFYKGLIATTSGGADVAYLLASAPIVYDRTNNKLHSVYNSGAGMIHVLIPGKPEKVFDSPITLSGSGSYLYFDDFKNSFFASSSEYPVNSHYYKLGELTAYSGKDYRATADALFLIGNNAPLLEFDYIHKVLHVTIPASTYSYYKQGFQTITEETYDLNFGDGNWLLFYNVITKKFAVHNNFTDYRNWFEYVPIGYFRNGIIQCLIPYKVSVVDRKLFGKKIVTYGDSLVWYDGKTFNTGAEQGNTCYGFQSYLTKYYGAVVTNKGTNGGTDLDIFETITSDTANLSSFDYVMYMPSIDNDMRLSVPVGTVLGVGGTFDTDTVAGAIQASIEAILTAKPSIRIVLMTEPKGWVYRNNTPTLNDIAYYNAIKAIAELYSLPLIDLWKESGINEKTRNTFINDPSFENGNNWYMFHPNNKGWERLSRIIGNSMDQF